MWLQCANITHRGPQEQCSVAYFPEMCCSVVSGAHVERLIRAGKISPNNENLAEKLPTVIIVFKRVENE